MLGWSAGSHLLLNIATHHDVGDRDAVDPIARQSCRPDFVAMMCLWPKAAKPESFKIDADTPPAFICSAHDDKVAPTAFSQAIRDAYKAAGVEATLEEVETGGHEAFTIDGPGPGGKWTQKFWPWMKKIGVVPEVKG